MSMGFSRQEYRSRLPFPFPEDLPDSGIKPASPALQVDSLPLSQMGKEAQQGLLLASFSDEATEEQRDSAF